MRKRIFITLFFCFSTLLAFAQDESQVNAGSFYSKYGIGMPVDYGSSSADGMGLWGVSYTESLIPSVANPAQWGKTIYGMGTGGLQVNNHHARDNTGSADYTLVALNHFQLQLPVYKGKLGVSASFNPYTRTAFENTNRNQRILPNATDQQAIYYQTTNTGSGGINQMELGLGWQINKNIAVGYAASLYFSSIDNNFTTNFYTDDSYSSGSLDNSFTNVNTTYQISGSGFGNRLGAMLTIPSVFRDNDQFNIGLSAQLPVSINADKEIEAIYVSGDPEDPDSDIKEKVSSGEIQLPLGLTAGLSYEPSNYLSFTTEGRYEQWSEYKNEVNQPVQGVQFSDRVKIGAGLRYFPFVSGSDKFLSHFKYRFGATYDSGHLKVNGENVETLMLSAGLGILSPSEVQGFRSSVDINFYYGIRGTKNQNLVKENIWGVKLSLNLAELFFFRPKLQ